MDFARRTWLGAFALIMLIMISIMDNICAHGVQQVPCYFIFGDSLADSGNNNLLKTKATANYSPYGIDFPQGVPTGRFTNGRTSADIIGELLGFDNFIPSFATVQKSNILEGVNYASGSSGIRNESGQHLGQHISFDGQLDNHQIVVESIVKVLGSPSAAADHLAQCLYSVGLGSNDYINNYFLPDIYPRVKEYSPKQFAGVLVDQYEKQIKRLYGYGARKIALHGLGYIGCTPFAISTMGRKRSAATPCVTKMNTAAELFNFRLRLLVNQWNKAQLGGKLVFLNSTGMSSLPHISLESKMVTDKGCCEVNEIGQCAANKLPCPNRAEYVFWDSFHPTEVVNQATARRSLNAIDPFDSYPYDISQLIKL